MEHKSLFKIVDTIIARGLEAIKANTDGYEFSLDYVAIFAKDQAEFDEMLHCAESLGTEVDLASAKTGKTFKLSEPKTIDDRILKVLKIRRPDQTRPQRGAPDFVVNDYQKFKDQYLSSSGNFTLMVRKDYEMIELKGIEVLVYLKKESFSRAIVV